MPHRAELPRDCMTKAEHDQWVTDNGRPVTDRWYRSNQPPGLVEGQPLADIGLTIR